MRCKKCKHYFILRNDRGLCRISPPVISEPFEYAIFPIVNPFWLCGMFSKKEEVKSDGTSTTLLFPRKVEVNMGCKGKGKGKKKKGK